MSLAPVIELSALDGTEGFRISGVSANDQSGFSLASAGDVNGDGIDDLIIGARIADPTGVNTGASYVVFGRDTVAAGDFAANIDLAALDGTNGFRITGVGATDQSGGSVASAGDVNGDGIDDLIIGARTADANGADSGASYVVFGRDTATAGDFAANIDLGALDGTNGFRIVGAAAEDYSGFSVASAGDVNGDGVDDLIVGAWNADPNGAYSGASYVVFGKEAATAGAFAADLNLSALDGTNGFRISGVAPNDQSGSSVASAGDVNGDGVDDLIVGAWNADPNGADSGASYVVFGKDTAVAGAFAANLELSALNGTNGFRLSGVALGDVSGYSVASAGDVNGDGVDDLIVGARNADANGLNSGASYVVFGKDTAVAGDFAADLNLSALDGTNGFRISGAAADDQSGYSVASAGDVNGDGIDDLIVGARSADPNGLSSGSSYVVFGRNTAVAGAFAANLDLGALDGTDGVRIDGAAINDASGRSVASAGDVNGDGFDDLLIGANGVDANGSNSGASYVVFGQPMAFVGTAADQTGGGWAGADSMSGAGGKDRLSGMGGDDVLDGGDGNDLLYGGAGADDLVGGLGGDILQGDDGDDGLDGGGGADKLFGGLGVDGLQGGVGADRLDGGTGDDSLDGGGDNDLLDGGLGADAMIGGLGNDVFVVDDVGDTTTEAAGQGYDIVRTALNGWVLDDDIEALELQGSADIDGQGNDLANNLQGNSGANTLSGLAGNDTINGADGDDIIIGGQGGDLLRGGLGADTFRVEHAFGGGLETDQIYDFSTAEGDIMDFSGAFAGTIAKVDAFTHTAGEMTLNFASGVTTVKLDIDGNGVAEYWARINGDVTGDWGGWLL